VIYSNDSERFWIFFDEHCALTKIQT